MNISTFIKALVICFVPCALVGQATATAFMSQAPLTDISNFLRQVSSNPPASLVLLDTSDKAWEQEFERIRREDPYAILNLNYISLSIDQGVGSELREREGWPTQKPRWAIFNAEGRIVADGAILPTSTQLADACSSAGIISRLETYRRFLREYPGHEEARSILVQEMLATAEIRTRNALQVPESRAAGPTQINFGGAGVRLDGQNSGDPSAEQIESLPELATEADERIWRDYCIELLRHLEGVLWQSKWNTPTISIPRIVPGANALTVRTSGPSLRDSKPIVSAWAVFSPTARAAYSRASSTVEAALMRQPSSSTLWELWVTLQKAGAGRSMKALLDNLQPSPSVAPDDWPPASVHASYLKLCRETGDWKTIRELVEPKWNSLVSQSALISQALSRSSSTISGLPPGATMSSIIPNSFNQGFWSSNGEAYLEALLMQQRLSDAENMMKTWASNNGWSGAFSSAAAIAERLGYESVGKSWRALEKK